MSFIDSVTSSLVSKALDVTLQNHRVIANNIANVSTTGFRPAKLDFKELMAPVAEVISSGGSDESLKSALDQVDGMSAVEVASGDESVNIDHEMVALAENVLRYQMLLGARDLTGQIMSSAINGGR